MGVFLSQFEVGQLRNKMLIGGFCYVNDQSMYMYFFYALGGWGKGNKPCEKDDLESRIQTYSFQYFLLVKNISQVNCPLLLHISLPLLDSL